MKIVMITPEIMKSTKLVITLLTGTTNRGK